MIEKGTFKIHSIYKLINGKNLYHYGLYFFSNNKRRDYGESKSIISFDDY